MQRICYPIGIIDKVMMLKKVECPKGIDYPCILCRECENANYTEFSTERGDMLLKWTTNSAILLVNFPLRDELDEILLNELKREIAREFRFVLPESEENYHLTLFIKYTDISDERTAKQIREFILKDLKEIMGWITKGRMLIKDWARDTIKKLTASRI